MSNIKNTDQQYVAGTYGRVPHAILMELLTDEGAGTMVMGE